MALQVLHERLAGMDVHKKGVTVFSITPEKRETLFFGTMTKQLLERVDCFLARGITHVAMEATGSYWKPIYNLLEDSGIHVDVVNPAHIKAVPGRKTDVKDAEWIADLLQHGLLRGSFIPDRAQREVRELVRYRTSLVNERADEVNRVQKVLEGANIKLSSVATDVLGVSGRKMLKALIAGETDPKVLAGMAVGRLQSKEAELEQAMYGCMGSHQRLMLSRILEHIEFLEKQIEGLNREAAERMDPFEETLELLDTIPGVGRQTAEESSG